MAELLPPVCTPLKAGFERLERLQRRRPRMLVGLQRFTPRGRRISRVW